MSVLALSTTGIATCHARKAPSSALWPNNATWRTPLTQKARRQFLKKLDYLTTPELPSDNDLLLRIDAMNLENVFGDIQTNRGNLHVDGSLM